VALTFFPFTDEKYFSLFCCFNGEKCERIFLYEITVKHDYSYVENSVLSDASVDDLQESLGAHRSDNTGKFFEELIFW
jgi:hypothetical protein